MLLVTAGVDHEDAVRPQHAKSFAEKPLDVREISGVAIFALSVIEMVKNLIADYSVECFIRIRKFRNATLIDLHVRVGGESFSGDLVHARVKFQAMQLADSTAKIGQTTARPTAGVQNRLLPQGNRRRGQKIHDDRKTDRDSRVVIAAGCAVVILVFDSVRCLGLTGGTSTGSFHIHLQQCCFIDQSGSP